MASFDLLLTEFGAILGSALLVLAPADATATAKDDDDEATTDSVTELAVEVDGRASALSVRCAESTLIRLILGLLWSFDCSELQTAEIDAVDGVCIMNTCS